MHANTILLTFHLDASVDPNDSTAMCVLRYPRVSSNHPARSLNADACLVCVDALILGRIALSSEQELPFGDWRCGPSSKDQHRCENSGWEAGKAADIVTIFFCERWHASARSSTRYAGL